MEALNEPFQTATDVHEIPGVTLAVANGNGMILNLIPVIVRTRLS